VLGEETDDSAVVEPVESGTVTIVRPDNAGE
jgi:hypothetical protein